MSAPHEQRAPSVKNHYWGSVISTVTKPSDHIMVNWSSGPRTFHVYSASRPGQREQLTRAPRVGPGGAGGESSRGRTGRVAGAGDERRGSRAGGARLRPE
jgi:hypothetical protein